MDLSSHMMIPVTRPGHHLHHQPVCHQSTSFTETQAQREERSERLCLSVCVILTKLYHLECVSSVCLYATNGYKTFEAFEDQRHSQQTSGHFSTNLFHVNFLINIWYNHQPTNQKTREEKNIII